MNGLIAGLLMLASGAAYAYQKPAGVPELALPDGRTIAVFAAQTAVGNGIGVFDLRNGDWMLCGQCLIDPETASSFDSIVNASGGPRGYVESKLPRINDVLRIHYTVLGSPNTVVIDSPTVLDQVNAAFGSYSIRIVGGAPVLGSK